MLYDEIRVNQHHYCVVYAFVGMSKVSRYMVFPIEIGSFYPKAILVAILCVTVNKTFEEAFIWNNSKFCFISLDESRKIK